jgi:hypothetical protein
MGTGGGLYIVNCRSFQPHERNCVKGLFPKEVIYVFLPKLYTLENNNLTNVFEVHQSMTVVLLRVE